MDWIHGLLDGGMEEFIDYWITGFKNSQITGWKDGRILGFLDGEMEELMYYLMERWKN